MVVDLPFAPLSILFFLASCMAAVVCFAVIVFAMVARNVTLAKLVGVLLGGGLAVYAILLMAFSLSSHDRLLLRGEEKHFCEVDCHIAYSVANVQRNGNEYLVTLKTRFDENTINPQRGNGLLTPNPHNVALLDDGGHRVFPANAEATHELLKPLHPGESYMTEFRFTVPSGMAPTRLLVAGEPWPNLLLIGHENSPLHKKAYFQL